MIGAIRGRDHPRGPRRPLATMDRDVPDALLAAQARAMDAELITFDRGFRDYPGLRVQIL